MRRLRLQLLCLSICGLLAWPASATAPTPVTDVPVPARENLWPGIGIASEDGAHSIKLHGRFLIDAGTGAGDGDATFRRARLGVSGELAHDFYYKVENDYAVDNIDGGITDIYLGYDFNPHWYVQAGQFKQPYNLENLTTSRFATFEERGLVTAFTPGRRVGAMVGTYQPAGDTSWTAMLGYFDGAIGVNRNTDDTHELAGRITWAYQPEPSHLMHLGLAGIHRTPDNTADKLEYNTVPESRFSGGDFADTGPILGVEHAIHTGLEAAGVWGPFSLQSEYMRVDVAREAAPDAIFDGYYLQASYFLTGEHRVYSPERAIFGRAHPLDPVAEGGWGAWQLAARYSTIDMTDGGINGGRVDNVSLGVNWLPHHQVTMMGNVIFANADESGPANGDDPTLFMMRLQFDF